jgi:hypothetical protein
VITLACGEESILNFEQTIYIAALRLDIRILGIDADGIALLVPSDVKDWLKLDM